MGKPDTGPRSKFLRQATLTLKGTIDNNGQTPTTEDKGKTTINSFLTASTADTPLSDHGSWANDEEDQVLISIDPDQEDFTPPEMYVDPTTVNSSVPMEGVVMTPTTGTKRAMPFNSPHKNTENRSRATGKSTRTAGKNSVNSTSAEEEYYEETATGTAKKKINRQKKTPEQKREDMKTAEQNQTMDTSHPLYQMVMELSQKVESMQVNLNQYNTDVQRARTDFDHLSNTQLAAYEAFDHMKKEVIDIKNRMTTQSAHVQEMNQIMGEHTRDIAGLNHKVAKVVKEQEEMKASIAELYRRGTTEMAGGEQKNTQASSLFVGGLQQLRKWTQDANSDPVELVAELFRHLHLYSSVTRISLADNESRNTGNRMAARAAIIVMNSPQHRREAIIRIKRFLNENRQNGLEGVTAGDCFPQEMLAKVRGLGRYATAKKREGKIFRFRVINRNGLPILQTSQRNQPFQEETPDPAELESYMDGAANSMETDEVESANSTRGAGVATGANTQQMKGARNKTRPVKPDQSKGNNEQQAAKQYNKQQNTNNNPNSAANTDQYEQQTHNYREQHQANQQRQAYGGPGEMPAGFHRAQQLPMVPPPGPSQPTNMAWGITTHGGKQQHRERLPYGPGYGGNSTEGGRGAHYTGDEHKRGPQSRGPPGQGSSRDDYASSS